MNDQTLILFLGYAAQAVDVLSVLLLVILDGLRLHRKQATEIEEERKQRAAFVAAWKRRRAELCATGLPDEAPRGVKGSLSPEDRGGAGTERRPPVKIKIVCVP